VLRILLTVVLGAGLAVLLLAQERTALLIALLVLLLAFLLGAAQLAVDLVDLTPSDLVADGGLLVVLGLAFTRITTGDRLLITALMAVALATQAAPLVLRRARPRHA
jgi:hypothetical protein